MTWSYDNAIPTDRDRVRLYIQDTDDTDQLLQDEELDFLLTDEGSVFRAAAAAAEIIANFFSRQVDYQIPQEMQEFASQRSSQYRTMAKDLRRKAARRKAVPLAGGISKRDKTIELQDPDRVVPFFDRTMETEPGTEQDEPLTRIVPTIP